VPSSATLANKRAGSAPRATTISGMPGRRAHTLSILFCTKQWFSWRRSARLKGEPMGHIRLGTLPKTHKWQRVVGLIAGGADVERIAAASADAAEHGLERASQDHGLAHAFWLLTQIPQAARQIDLSRLGERESGTARLEEAVAAYREALQEFTRACRSIGPRPSGVLLVFHGLIHRA
jgi:hypothetical protein